MYEPWGGYLKYDQKFERNYRNHVFRQMLNFSPSGRLREKDGGECFAPFAFALLRAEMKCFKTVAQDARRSQKSKKILNLRNTVKTSFSL